GLARDSGRALAERHPGLRGPGPDVSDRPEPARVVERARLDDGKLREVDGLAPELPAALGAEPSRLLPAVRHGHPVVSGCRSDNRRKLSGSSGSGVGDVTV